MVKPCMTRHGLSMKKPPMGSLVISMKTLQATVVTAPRRYAQSMRSMTTAHITKTAEPAAYYESSMKHSQAWLVFYFNISPWAGLPFY